MGNCLHLHPESTKYSTASVNSRLLRVQLRIPEHRGRSLPSAYPSSRLDTTFFFHVSILPQAYLLVNTVSKVQKDEEVPYLARVCILLCFLAAAVIVIRVLRLSKR